MPPRPQHNHGFSNIHDMYALNHILICILEKGEREMREVRTCHVEQYKKWLVDSSGKRANNGAFDLCLRSSHRSTRRGNPSASPSLLSSSFLSSPPLLSYFALFLFSRLLLSFFLFSPLLPLPAWLPRTLCCSSRTRCPRKIPRSPLRTATLSGRRMAQDIAQRE